MPVRRQHERPCGDCPWRRIAVPGWLGSLSPQMWLEAVHGESEIECHTRAGLQCAGAAIYRTNVAKRPRERSLLVLPADKVLVFATPREFLLHHTRLERNVP